MKKLVVLLAILVLVLGSISVVSAQGTDTSSSNSQSATQVTVNWDGANTLTLSPTTVPANQRVQFVFTGQGNSAPGNFAFVIFQGSTGDTVFSANGQQAVMQGSATDSNNNTFTFTQEGAYTLGVFSTASGQTNQTFTRSQAMATADFTVSASAAGGTTAQAGSTATPAATSTITATATTTNTVTSTATAVSSSSGQTGASAGQAPQTVPTTGGDTAPWAMLALAALALLAGGVLLATRPNR